MDNNQLEMIEIRGTASTPPSRFCNLISDNRLTLKSGAVWTVPGGWRQEPFISLSIIVPVILGLSIEMGTSVSERYPNITLVPDAEVSMVFATT